MLIHFDERDWLIGIGVLCLTLLFLWWKKHRFSYILFLSVFWVYLLAVVQAVIFPIAINTEYSNTVFTPSVNLTPFDFGDCSILNLCVRGFIENIVLTIPFGFGINFLIRVKPRYLFWLALAVGSVFECSQLSISLALRTGFRAVDINDVISNGTGVLIGYTFFRLFAWAYLKAAVEYAFKYKWLLADIYDVVFQTQVLAGQKASDK